MNKCITPPKPTEIEIQMFPDGRMDTKNAAQYLGISEKTLATYRCKGTSPKFIKRSRRIFYFQTDLDEWLDETPKFTSTGQARINERRTK